MKPFTKPHESFLIIPNCLFDEVMSELPPHEFVLLLVVYRMTRGWNKDTDKISYSQLMNLSGFGSRGTIAKYLKSLEERGMIIIERGDREEANTYRLNEDYEVGSSRDELGGSSRNELGVVHEMNSQKTYKDIVKDKHTGLVGLSEEDKNILKMTGILPPPKNAIQDAIWDYPPDVQDAVLAFCRTWKMPAPTKRTKQFKLWISAARDIQRMCSDAGFTPEEVMQEIYSDWDNGNGGSFRVYGIQSIQNVVWKAVSNLVTGRGKGKKYYDSSGKQVLK